MTTDSRFAIVIVAKYVVRLVVVIRFEAYAILVKYIVRFVIVIRPVVVVRFVVRFKAVDSQLEDGIVSLSTSTITRHLASYLR